MIYLAVKNFEKYQHYGDRRPIWIKLYSALLDDRDFEQLKDAAKAHLILIWLLASKLPDRLVPWDEKWIAKKIGASDPVRLQVLVDHGFLIPQNDASNTLAEGYQSASVEKRREEKTREDESGVIEEIIGYYKSLHPQRRPGDRDRGFVGRRLKTHSADEIKAAIRGNADDPWHREKGKHELEYILRDSKIDDFRLRPEPKKPITVAEWLKDEIDILPGTNCFTPKWDLCTNPDRAAEWERTKRQYNIVEAA